MADPARKTNPWPFLAISLLVALLGTFVILKFLKSGKETPVVVKPPQGPEEGKSESELEAEKLKREREHFVMVAMKHIEEKHPDPADKAIENARKIAPGADLDDLAKAVASLREELKKAKKDLKQPFRAVEEEVIADWKKDIYDLPLERLRKAVEKEPELETYPDFVKFRKRAAQNRDDAADLFKKNREKAEAELQAGNYSEALKALGLARTFYPEHAGELADLEARIKEEMSKTSMVRIAEGDAMIGIEPLRKYHTKGFWIDQHKVTNEEYAAFVQATHRRAPAGWTVDDKPMKGTEKHPVVNVTLADAEAYAKWIGKRLPTEEEWEMAARWIDGRVYPWGDDFVSKENAFRANCQEYWQVHRDKAPGTLPVDAFVPKDAKDLNTPNGKSPFGVWDIVGNAWEWTSTHVNIQREGKNVAMHVQKGGSFMTNKEALRCSSRLLEEPDLFHPDVGFRCAKD